jgi:deazaflavin-dependent oxidoreductase (nitroreductase family)
LIGARLDGLDVLLLTTTGAKSGNQRCIPLPYFRDGERILLVASFGGNRKNPAWIANITANPAVHVQLRAKQWTARARISEGAERQRLWAGITDEFPRYGNYQSKTERLIPVVVLE